MLKPPLDPLSYAGPSTPRAPKRRLRLALIAVLPVLVTPLLAAVLLGAADRRVLPEHFLCCNHPEVTVGGFIVLPSVGAVCGVVSVGRLLRGRRMLKGWVPAVIAILVNPLLALARWVVYGGVRA